MDTRILVCVAVGIILFCTIHSSESLPMSVLDETQEELLSRPKDEISHQLPQIDHSKERSLHRIKRQALLPVKLPLRIALVGQNLIRYFKNQLLQTFARFLAFIRTVAIRV